MSLLAVDLLRLTLAGDDAARSVYADQLIAKGDPRGEFIAVELAPPTPARRRRRAELLDAHARAWWPEFEPFRLRTRRGFVESVLARSKELEKSTTLVEREPVTELELVGHDLMIPDAWRARLRSLVLCADGEAEEMIALLRACPRLESFAVHNTVLAAHQLPLGNVLPACKRLSFAGQHLFQGAATCLEWNHIGKVEHLDLSGCQIDGKTLDAILARGLPKLETLRLSSNRLGDGARWAFTRQLAKLPALRRLELADNGIAMADVDAIAKLRPDVELVHEYQRPERLAVTIMNAHVEFIARRDQQWVVEIDGRPAEIKLRWHEKAATPIEPIVRALVTGHPILHDRYGVATVSTAADTSRILVEPERVTIDHELLIEY